MNSIRYSAFVFLASSVAIAACGDSTATDDATTSSTSTSTSGSSASSSSSSGSGGGGTVPVYTSYTEATPPASVQFADVCTPTAAMSDNSLGSPITLPFPVHFYNATYDSVRVSIHGWISFSEFLTDSEPRNQTGVLPLPVFESPNAAIYALWEALSLRDAQGNVSLDNLEPCYATVGTAPNRSFIVEWKNAYFYDPGAGSGITDNLTFEIALNESDDSIDVLYDTIEPEADHAARLGFVTIGIENEDTDPAHPNGHGGTKATQSTKVPASGLGIRYVPVK